MPVTAYLLDKETEEGRKRWLTPREGKKRKGEGVTHRRPKGYAFLLHELEEGTASLTKGKKRERGSLLAIFTGAGKQSEL